MKKILLFALVIAILTGFAFTAVQAPVAADSVAAAALCPRAANTGLCAPGQPEAPVQAIPFKVFPPVSPNVGWNS